MISAAKVHGLYFNNVYFIVIKMTYYHGKLGAYTEKHKEETFSQF